ncbi:hypothetical protein TNCV_675951 [Trichonephila clavipes]|nr:hypothetical protein TNCV_675951 [Trichonephila clavipes]
MIQQLFLSTHQERCLDNVWLQQDGTTSLISRVSMCTLRANWSTHSPDLSLNYYFLQAYLKSLVYKDHSTRGLLATDYATLNHGQVTWTTLELASTLLTTTPTGGRLSSPQIYGASLPYTASLQW